MNVKKIPSLSITLVVFTAVVLLGGCAGTPEKNPLLEEAKSNYQQAENDSMIVMKAPVALKEAEEELQTGENLWQDGAKEVLVTHHAYIAKQKVAIARETAAMNAAQDEVEQAEAERQRVLIQARRTEADAAERRAKEALEQARQERAEAVEARKRAQELSERVNELEARQTKRGLVLTLGDVLFDFDKATLKPGGQRAIDKLTTFLNEYPERNIMIEGYTDDQGSASYNQTLSLRRADAVKQALLQNNINPTRTRIRGYGEQYPVAGNNTSAGRQRNRRVEVVISDENGKIPERGQ